MGYDEYRSDVLRRLDDLQRLLKEKEAVVGRSEDMPRHHREQIEKIDAKARAVRKMLPDAEVSEWGAGKHEVEADLEALVHIFERWINQVDEEYRHHDP